MQIMVSTVLFLLGGFGYTGLELMWRGRTHGSMFLAGGLCLLLVGHLQEVRPRLPLPLRILAGALVITAAELGIGLLVNRSYAVWDYRGMAGNWLGQICPAFSALWLFLSALALGLHSLVGRTADRLHNRWENRKKGG